jgi:hypothetical protein
MLDFGQFGMKRSCVRVVVVLLMVAPAAATAVLTRSDRDDDEYVELATRYASAVPLGLGQGEGVAVAPRWILTAAHRAVLLRDLRPRPRLRIDAREYDVEDVITHPEWNGAMNDLGLVRITMPLAIAPTPTCRDPDENAKTVVVVAHGGGGRLGARDAHGSERRKRAYINTIESLGARTFELRVKPGDEASDLQGAALREETGAPAYLEDEGKPCVAGILQAVEEPDAKAASGSVGERERFTRLSAYNWWIDAVTRK